MQRGDIRWIPEFCLSAFGRLCILPARSMYIWAGKDEAFLNCALISMSWASGWGRLVSGVHESESVAPEEEWPFSSWRDSTFSHNNSPPEACKGATSDCAPRQSGVREAAHKGQGHHPEEVDNRMCASQRFAPQVAQGCPHCGGHHRPLPQDVLVRTE